jgi:predicted  nucleic acid-binding Zn-ribbon protein
MADDQPQYVTRDQHRADLAELRGELREELAGLRQDVAVLTKMVEAQGQRMEQRFEAQTKNFDQRFEAQAKSFDQRFDHLDQQVGQLRQEFVEFRREVRGMQTNITRQLWTMVCVVTFAVLTGVIKLVFFP